MTAGTAPRARALQLRVAGVYLAAVVVGLVLLVATNSPPWRAIGVGLWLPGAGFLLAGGMWSLMFVLILLLFASTVAAWLRVGAATLPGLLWLAAALGSAGATGNSASSAGVQAAVALLLVTLTIVIGVWVERIVRVSRQRAWRSGYLPYRTALVTTTAAATARDVAPPDELTPEALHGLRLIFDLALQPVGDYTGYDRGRRFGRTALHEQISTCGYALSLAHAHYTPKFLGYSTEAQRQLIETSLRQPVWSYWRVQNAWGNLRFDGDPVGRGRMDFTGAFALQVALYTALTRDERYLRLGALTFEGVGGTAYRHDLRGLAALLDDHIADTRFGLASGPPDWVDVAANMRGLAALHLVDRITGGDSFDRHVQHVESAISTEFFAPDLGLVSARSARTGFGRRYARPGASPAALLNWFFPHLAVRVWAQQREEHFTERDKHLLATPGGAALLERPAEQTAAFESLYQGAQEHGDRDAAAAALDALDRLARPASDGTGARQHYPSKVLTFAVVLDRLLFRGAWRAAVGVPPAAAALDGPMLRDVAYPGVLVAKATSTGTDLTLVLYPGAGDGVRELSLGGLIPGRRYRLTTTAGTREFTSAADGRAVVGAAVSGRTAVSIEPV